MLFDVCMDTVRLPDFRYWLDYTDMVRGSQITNECTPVTKIFTQFEISWNKYNEKPGDEEKAVI